MTTDAHVRIDSVRRVLDVPFASPDGHELCLDLYLPEPAPRPLPVIMWLHGGGWSRGDRKLGPDLERHFGARGFAMVSIDYRLSTQACFPAQVEDVKTAIRWVRSAAGQYELDAGAIGLFGSSAGAHLAAIAALSAPGEFEDPGSLYAQHPSGVQAVVAGYGPSALLTMDAQRLDDPAGDDDPEGICLPAGARSADADSFESALIGAPLEARPDLARRASPLTYVRPGCAPFLIMHGRADRAIPCQQSRDLFDALIAQDNDATFCLIDRLGHGFLNRTALDDAGPRDMTVFTRSHDRSSKSERRRSTVFPLAEAFFRRLLLRP